MVVEEASALGLPPGYWPTDIKCRECSGNAPQKSKELYNGEVAVVVYQCTSCEEEIHILND